MNNKRPRVFGTTENAIARAEASLGRTFPPSFRSWLVRNNGRGIKDITIFPVMDQRDPRTTWDSIDRRVREGWADWLANFEDEHRDFTHLLPFANYGTGDYYCLDYSRLDSQGECPIVRWSHETGATDDRAASFSEFITRVRQESSTMIEPLHWQTKLRRESVYPRFNLLIQYHAKSSFTSARCQASMN